MTTRRAARPAGSGTRTAARSRSTTRPSTTTSTTTPGATTSMAIGGGIYQADPDSLMTLDNTQVNGNTAQGRGGGIYITNGRIFIDHSRSATTRSTARATAGESTRAATSKNPAAVRITDSTVADNTTGRAGGGYFNPDRQEGRCSSTAPRSVAIGRDRGRRPPHAGWTPRSPTRRSRTTSPGRGRRHLRQGQDHRGLQRDDQPQHVANGAAVPGGPAVTDSAVTAAPAMTGTTSSGTRSSPTTTTRGRSRTAAPR